MVDLNMPDGLSDDERVRWLREPGAAVVCETGQPSGQITLCNSDGHPSWFMWWADEDDLPRDPAVEATSTPATRDLGGSGADV
jgi:hypothetical protein